MFDLDFKLFHWVLYHTRPRWNMHVWLSSVKLYYLFFPIGACDGVSCDFHGTCQHEPLSFSRYRCACPNCTAGRGTSTDTRVCGSDDITYESECFMKKNSCLKKTKITIAYNGPCSKSSHVLFSSLSECRIWIWIDLSYSRVAIIHMSKFNPGTVEKNL